MVAAPGLLALGPRRPPQPGACPARRRSKSDPVLRAPASPSAAGPGPSGETGRGRNTPDQALVPARRARLNLVPDPAAAARGILGSGPRGGLLNRAFSPRDGGLTAKPPESTETERDFCGFGSRPGPVLLGKPAAAATLGWRPPLFWHPARPGPSGAGRGRGTSFTCSLLLPVWSSLAAGGGGLSTAPPVARSGPGQARRPEFMRGVLQRSSLLNSRVLHWTIDTALGSAVLRAGLSSSGALGWRPGLVPRRS